MIDVIMCAWNKKDTVEQAIQSILHQTMGRINLIVTDDCSDDGTEGILGRYWQRCMLNRNPTRLGFTMSLIQTIKQGTNDFVAINHADDISEPTRLQAQLEFLKSHSDVVVVGSGFRTYGCWIPRTYQVPTDHQAILDAIYTPRSYMPHSSFMFRREAYEQAGGYDSRFLKAQDRHLLLKLSKIGLLAAINEPLVNIYKGPGRVSTSDGHSQRAYGLSAILETLGFNERLRWLDGQKR